jgi:hypothetical protein
MTAERRFMDVRQVTVLLVGNGARNAPTLEDHLLRRGCHICFATSKKEALQLLRRGRFDVVLSEFMLSDGTAYHLMAPLLGTRTTMFFSDAVEDGCWWMMAVFEGQDRSAEPGMRPSEFRCLLDQILFDKLFQNTSQPAKERPYGVTSHAER